MRIVIYEKSTNLKHQQEILKNLYQSLKDKGLNVIYWEENEWKPADIPVIFGSWKKTIKQKKGVILPEEQKHHILKQEIVRRQGVNSIIVLETPLLGRTITSEHEQYRFGLYHFMNKLSDFKNKNSKPDRFEKLGLKIKPWRKEGDHILICCQNLNDASLFGLHYTWWLDNTIHHLLKRTKRKIIVRDHPENKTKLLDFLNRSFMSHTKQVEYQNTGTIQEALKGAHCVVNYSSGSSIDAILEGIPVIPGTEYNFVWDISSHSLDDIENPKLGNREQLLYDLAYSQWSVEEIENGTAWNHLISQ